MLAMLLFMFTGQVRQSPLAGWWTGQSHCVGQRPACHEENTVYQIEPRAGQFVLHGFRVSGRDTVDMGDLSCSPGGEPAGIVCDIPVGRWHFWIAGDHLEGTLTHRDGTLARQVRAIRRPTTR